MHIRLFWFVIPTSILGPYSTIGINTGTVVGVDTFCHSIGGSISDINSTSSSIMIFFVLPGGSVHPVEILVSIYL